MKTGVEPHEALMLAVWLGVSVAGCGGDGPESGGSPRSKPTDVRFLDAEGLNAGWCLQGLLHVTGLEPDAISIELTMHDSPLSLGGQKAVIDPDADPILQIHGVVTSSPDHQPPAPAELSSEVWCKLRSKDRIEVAAGTTLPGEQGDCRDINQLALDWALGALTQQERDRYQQEAHQLLLGEDLLGAAGPAWYAMPSQLAEGPDGYTLSASALLVKAADPPGPPDAGDGTHYCKLITPSQALYWMLVRGYSDAPELPGDGRDGEPCIPSNAPAAGSCIFVFSITGDPYCEEYTGTGWTRQTAEAKCEERQGSFTATACIERGDETAAIGPSYSGACIRNCGQSTEFQWHIYDEEGADTSAYTDYCPDFLPPM